MSSDVRAVEGFVDPESYDRGRPPFPSEGVGTLVAAVGLKRNSVVLDLGAGTGKLTAELVPLVCDVVAVDPSSPMLDTLQRRLPTVDVRLGVAEDIPLGDQTVDAVFVAEAFHWFRTAVAAREIGRVLVPDGHLVLAWQRRLWWDTKRLPWIAEFDRRLEPFWELSTKLAGEHPNVTKHWEAELDRVGLFKPFSTVAAEFEHRLTVDDFVAFVASWSWIAILPRHEHQQALATVSELLSGHEELALPYRAEFQFARRRP